MKATHTDFDFYGHKEGYTTSRTNVFRSETFGYLADTVYLERRRIQEENNSDYEGPIDFSSPLLERFKRSMHAALMNLTNTYVEEIHTHFSNRTYDLASKLLPSALTGPALASHPISSAGKRFRSGLRF